MTVVYLILSMSALEMITASFWLFLRVLFRIDLISSNDTTVAFGGSPLLAFVPLPPNRVSSTLDAFDLWLARDPILD